jgi:hypothetical protein
MQLAAADAGMLGVAAQIVGLPPFYSKDTKAAYQRLLTEPLEFKDHVSAAARALIKGLLVADPSKRLGAVPKDTGNEDGKAPASGVLQSAWGAAMPIKSQWWFKGLRWDAVLLRQVLPCQGPHCPLLAPLYRIAVCASQVGPGTLLARVQCVARPARRA